MNDFYKCHSMSAIGAMLIRAVFGAVLLLIALPIQAQLVNCPSTCVPITIRKKSSGTVNNTKSLPIPAFELKDGNVPYGSTVTVSAAGLPAGATIEYSADGGATWTTGLQVTVFTETTFLARTRQNNQVSSTVQGRFAPYYRRVFILGNSITAISQVPSIGWLGDWGMAASAADKDYLHLLTARLRERNADVQVKPIAGSSFERTWWTYDIGASLDEHLPFAPNGQGPDLIIVRLGENMDNSLVQSQNLETYYSQLLDYLKKFSTGPVKVIVTTTFWQGQDQVNAVFRKVAAAKGYPVADLHSLADNPAYRASQFSDPGLAIHPNDLGMQRIAELIWEQIK